MLGVFISTSLLYVLLLWCKYYFFHPTDQKIVIKHTDLLGIFLISFSFTLANYLIFNEDLFFNKKKNIFLDPKVQFEIGRSFYLGENLPKDNSQSLNWLLLSASQNNKDAQMLLQTLGYESQRKFEKGAESEPDFSLDIIPANKIKAKLNEIAGLKDAKAELNTLLTFIKSPEKFKKIGAHPPKGVILYGLPGTGKTMLARAIAGEANVTFISVSGAAFEEAYVGKGAARIRELFNIARKHKPAIIFIDEIDALAPSRDTKEISQSHVQTVNQLLSEMENVDDKKNEGLFILAATNRLEAIDNALLRAGRFDWQIHVKLPTDEERKEILQKLLKKVIVSQIDLDVLIEKSAGFTGADLNYLVNEAAIFAVANNRTAISKEDFDSSFKKLATYEKDLGPEFSVKILSANQIKTHFTDISGMNEAKEEVMEVIDFLKNPEKYNRLGAKPPTGILIYGPPGTGKTMMARSIAGEANATFISITGSAFDERYVGVGANRVRELFKLARKYKPCIVFIDEIDALAPHRTSDMSGRDQTINQFLSEMDNIQNQINEGIIFIGATNRLDAIDPALLRPGRFDRKVYFRIPSLQEREEILKAHLKKIKFSPDVNVATLAKITVGYSGADLANLVNEAAIDATRKNKLLVDMASFEEANDKIELGVNQKSDAYSTAERKRTAFHEAGHALVGLLHPDYPRTLHKMTIGLRGGTLGVTHFRLESDEFSYTKKELESLISAALGGYVAEELIYGKENVSSGSSNDLMSANKTAKKMVAKYGMADNLSFIVSEVFPDEAEMTQNAEIILQRSYKEAKDLLQKNQDKLHLLANELLEKETLDYNQIIKLLNLSKKNP